MTEKAVLAANAAFYRAFRDGDAEAMDLVWARSAAVACIHPGWPPLFGRDAVMKSWAGALSSSPAIAVESPRVVLTGGTAAVLCLERIGRSVLAATNLFVNEAGHWRIFHHHASAIARGAPRAKPPARPRVVH